jgi:restriction system protein
MDRIQDMWYFVDGGGIMGKIFDFIKKLGGNHKEIESIEESRLDELIDELQESLKADIAPSSVQPTLTPISETQERAKYHLTFSKGISPKENINQNIYDMTEELRELESELEEKRAEIDCIEKMCINRINSVSERKKKEISKLIRDLLEKQREVDKKIKDFRMGLLETEYRSLDWLNRIDKKETEIFEEIRNKVDLFNACNASPIEDGFDFEKTFAKALENNNFCEIKVTKKSGDFGADILAEKDGIKYVIQCKYYSSPVGIDSIQQVYAAKIYYSSHVAVVATNSVFTKAAKILAEETGVILWDGEKVNAMLGS